MISLKIVYKDGEKESLIFNQSVVTIGRSGDNDVSLISANGVSRHHAKLYTEGNNLIIEDLNSTNGIYVNSQKASKIAVEPKDVIEIGNVCIKAAVANLAESANQAVVLSEQGQEVSNSCSFESLKMYIPEAYDKIHEYAVEKVIIRSGSRIKFIEQGQEVEFGTIYSNEILLKLAKSISDASVNRIKIGNGISCTIVSPPLANNGVCILFEKANLKDLTLEECISENIICRDSLSVITEAYTKGRDIIFASQSRDTAYGLMLALVEEKDSRVCVLDRFAKLSIPKNGISFSASSSSDLLESGQFSNEAGLHRFLMDDLEYYSKSGLRTFVNLFNKGGIAFLQAANINKLHSKLGELSGFGIDFWCQVLVWLEQNDDKISVKNIYRTANTEQGLELVEIFGV